MTYLAQNGLMKNFDTVCNGACDNVSSIEEIRRKHSKDPIFTVALYSEYIHISLMAIQHLVQPASRTNTLFEDYVYKWGKTKRFCRI
jgi:hypothetical protein